MKRTYNKLVRDKIPDVIEQNGEKPIIRILDDKEYRTSLFEKAKEELREVETAESIDETKKELADLLEVVRAMAEYNGFSLSDIIEEADKKQMQEAAFRREYFLWELNKNGRNSYTFSSCRSHLRTSRKRQI